MVQDQFVTRRELDERLAAERKNTREWIATAVDESSRTQRRETETVLINVNGLVDKLAVRVDQTESIANRALAAFEAMPEMLSGQFAIFAQTIEAQETRIIEKLERQEATLQRFASYERFAKSSIVAGLRGIGAFLFGGTLARWIRRILEIVFVLSVVVVFFVSWYAALSVL